MDLKDRRRIWSKQYFDIRKLRRNNRQEQLELQVAQKFGRSVIRTSQADKREIQSFEEWLELFLRYVTIYGQRFPDEVPAMLNYQESVRTLARNFMSFRIYDENFRLALLSPGVAMGQHTE